MIKETWTEEMQEFEIISEFGRFDSFHSSITIFSLGLCIYIFYIHCCSRFVNGPSGFGPQKRY